MSGAVGNGAVPPPHDLEDIGPSAKCMAPHAPEVGVPRATPRLGATNGGASPAHELGGMEPAARCGQPRTLDVLLHYSAQEEAWVLVPLLPGAAPHAPNGRTSVDSDAGAGGGADGVPGPNGAAARLPRVLVEEPRHLGPDWARLAGARRLVLGLASEANPTDSAEVSRPPPASAEAEAELAKLRAKLQEAALQRSELQIALADARAQVEQSKADVRRLSGRHRQELDATAKQLAENFRASVRARVEAQGRLSEASQQEVAVAEREASMRQAELQAHGELQAAAEERRASLQNVAEAQQLSEQAHALEAKCRQGEAAQQELASRRLEAAELRMEATEQRLLAELKAAAEERGEEREMIFAETAEARAEARHRDHRIAELEAQGQRLRQDAAGHAEAEMAAASEAREAAAALASAQARASQDAAQLLSLGAKLEDAEATCCRRTEWAKGEVARAKDAAKAAQAKVAATLAASTTSRKALRTIAESSQDFHERRIDASFSDEDLRRAETSGRERYFEECMSVMRPAIAAVASLPSAQVDGSNPFEADSALNNAACSLAGALLALRGMSVAASNSSRGAPSRATQRPEGAAEAPERDWLELYNEQLAWALQDAVRTLRRCPAAKSKGAAAFTAICGTVSVCCLQRASLRQNHFQTLEALVPEVGKIGAKHPPVRTLLDLALAAHKAWLAHEGQLKLQRALLKLVMVDPSYIQDVRVLLLASMADKDAEAPALFWDLAAAASACGATASARSEKRRRLSGASAASNP